MKTREFLFYAEDQALAALPGDFPRPERVVMWTILQYHWGVPAAHIELQPQMGRRIIELGLHFEGPADWNEALVRRVSAHAGELHASLGPGWELEEWTASWRRLHRTWSFEELTRELGQEVGGELALALQVLRPFTLVEAPPAPARPAQREGPRRRAARR